MFRRKNNSAASNLRDVERTISFYKSELGEKLHSVYIRGSIAKGEGIDYVSDLDSFAVIQGEAGDEPKSLDIFHKEISEKYPFCTHVEISLIKIEDIKKPQPKRSRSFWESVATECLRLARF